jgi:hypothetical protein
LVDILNTVFFSLAFLRLAEGSQPRDIRDILVPDKPLEMEGAEEQGYIDVTSLVSFLTLPFHLAHQDGYVRIGAQALSWASKQKQS